MMRRGERRFEGKRHWCETKPHTYTYNIPEKQKRRKFDTSTADTPSLYWKSTIFVQQQLQSWCCGCREDPGAQLVASYASAGLTRATNRSQLAAFSSPLLVQTSHAMSLLSRSLRPCSLQAPVFRLSHLLSPVARRHLNKSALSSSKSAPSFAFAFE